MGLMIIQRRPQRALSGLPSQEDSEKHHLPTGSSPSPDSTSASTQSWASQTPEPKKRTPEPKKTHSRTKKINFVVYQLPSL